MSSFCICKNYSHFFSKNISVYAIFNDQSFNDMLTNDIISFEQLGPALKGMNLLPFRVDLFPKWTWCAGKQTENCAFIAYADKGPDHSDTVHLQSQIRASVAL